MFGLVAACTFTLIGWRKWGDLPPTVVTVVVVMANVTTTLASVLMLHVGFHGRLIALYQGNLQRVQFLSKLLRWVGVGWGVHTLSSVKTPCLPDGWRSSFGMNERG